MFLEGGHPDTEVTPGGDTGAGAKSSGTADIQGMLWAFPPGSRKSMSILDTLI